MAPPTKTTNDAVKHIKRAHSFQTIPPMVIVLCVVVCVNKGSEKEILSVWYIKRREQFSFSLEEKKIQRVLGMEWGRRK